MASAPPLFHDWRSAGAALADALAAYRTEDSLVLALPRGGVPVGFEVARALAAPLDVLVVRKLGVPGHEELAMGAIASGGTLVLDPDIVADSGIARRALEIRVRQQAAELVRRERAYREGRPPAELRGKTVILVDDGLATGASMRAAVTAVRECNVGRLVVAVPVGSPDTCAAMREVVDEVVCLQEPTPFLAVGLWYQDFTPTSDQEVQSLLARASSMSHASSLG